MNGKQLYKAESIFFLLFFFLPRIIICLLKILLILDYTLQSLNLYLSVLTSFGVYLVFELCMIYDCETKCYE